MSANNANLDKVKNMSSDESNPGVNSGAPEKGGVEFDSANIKKQDQAKMFTKVEGAEKRAREAAREEAAEKRADERLKNAEAAERRREEKEAKLVAAAKKDAERAQKHKVRRAIVKLLGIIVVLFLIIFPIVWIKILAPKASDKKFDECMKAYVALDSQARKEYSKTGSAASAIKIFESEMQKAEKGEELAASKIRYAELLLVLYGDDASTHVIKRSIDESLRNAKTDYQKRTILQTAIAILERFDDPEVSKYKDQLDKIPNNEIKADAENGR